MSAPVGKAKILVAEEDTQLLDVLKSLFRSLEHRVKSPTGPETLDDAVTNENPDVLVCSLQAWMAEKNHGTARTNWPPTIITADYAELEQARQVLKEDDGLQLLLTPIRAQNAIQMLQRALENRTHAPEHQNNESKADGHTEPQAEKHFGLLIGEHPTMQDTYRAIRQAAETTMTVLIRGESGTGKDLVARAIHQCSQRAAGPFVPVNCTAVSDNLLESELFGYAKGAFTGADQEKMGLFSVADGGTIFLDEIGSIPVSMQLSLLRVLQDKSFRPVGSTKTHTVDVRIIAATNENLEERIKDGLFREDLFFRLAAFPIRLAPLRERTPDISLLAAETLRDIAATLGRPLNFRPDAMAAMEHYSWPGNVRELINLIHRTAATLPRERQSIVAADLNLPRESTAQGKEPNTGCASADNETFITLKAYLKACERTYLRKVYDACGHDKEKAAKILGVSMGTFYRKLEE